MENKELVGTVVLEVKKGTDNQYFGSLIVNKTGDEGLDNYLDLWANIFNKQISYTKLFAELQQSGKNVSSLEDLMTYVKENDSEEGKKNE